MMSLMQLVDNGVMRLDECKIVKETLDDHLGISLTVVDASQRFLDALKGVVDSERKRKIIGGLFVCDFIDRDARSLIFWYSD